MKRYALAAAVLLSASGNGFASVTVDRHSGVGPWIAAQGNAALREIAEELKDGLLERLRPLLPLLPPANDAPQPKPAAAQPVPIAV